MPVTIVDIAHELNLSHTTVSRVLNNRRDISIPEKTRELVLKTAREMGYRRNPAARAMITGKTYNIGLLVERMIERAGPHFAKMLVAVERKARSLGYRVIVSGDSESMLKERIADGVVVLDPSDTASFVDMPYTCVSSAGQVSPNCVSWSDVDGAYRAGKYLLDLGHRNIAAVLGDIPEVYRQILPKGVGLRKALAEASLQVLECWGTRDTDQFENAYRLTKDLLKQAKDVTAIVARNDVMALGVIRALREGGKAIPRDVSVIGYNDTDYARYADPSLTSVRTPIEEAGEIATEELIRILESEESSFDGAILPTSITIRSSCAPPASLMD